MRTFVGALPLGNYNFGSGVFLCDEGTPLFRLSPNRLLKTQPNKAYKHKSNFVFQTLKHMFQTLQHIFQSLQHIFQSLQQTFLSHSIFNRLLGLPTFVTYKIAK